MTTSPTVSVVVPCFNAKQYVDEALGSVRNQTYSALDIIAVNDGSTDETPKLLERQAECDPRVRLVHQANRGLPAARNAGLRQARGEFVCFLDADDVLLPDKIEKQVRYLRDNPSTDLVYSDYLIGDDRLEWTGLVAARMPRCELIEAYARKNWFAPMVPLLRRRLIERVGEFDETLRASEDWDYWIRCAEAGGIFGYLPGPIAIYRTHASQMHNDSARMFANGKRVLNKHFRSTRLYRRALASFYERYATYAWHDGRRLRSGLLLALWAYHHRMEAAANLMRRREMGGAATRLAANQ